MEILNDGYNVESLDKDEFELKFCPKCKTGVMAPIKFKERTFLGCSNYPYCSPEKWA
jgi:ssDNA-binding Zn-finger/Zn-ribbon topoisomerase 1